MYQNDNFTKTGSGQTQQKLRTKGACSADHEYRYEPESIEGRQTRPVRKTPLFEPFMYRNDLFTKTGSGQT
jgi:hypothetical protein